MAWTTEQIFADISSDAIKFVIDTVFLRNTAVGLLALCLAYPTVHYILHRYTSKYKDLDNAIQNTVLQHAVEALYFTVSFPAFTYLFLSFNFQEPYDENGAMIPGAVRRYRDLIVLSFLLVVMYMIEIVLRYRKLNPFVLFHHMCTIVLMISCTIFPTAAFFKASLALIYFTTYEILTFYGLVMKVLLPFHKATPRMMVAGMIFFGITRPIQLAWILVVLIGSWEDHVKWQPIYQIIGTLVVSATQCAALKIHYAVWRRCVTRQVAAAESNVDTTKHEMVANAV